MSDATKLKDILDELSKQGNYIISNPSTISQLRDKGLPIKHTFVTFEEYIEKLFNEKRKNALELVKQLPQLDDSISSGVIADIYEEIRSSYALGIFTSTIVNSILLLEFAMKDRLYSERLKHDPNSAWEDLEKFDMDSLIQQLAKRKIITKKEKEQLVDFSINFRNPYFHINIQKLTKGVIITRLPQINVETQEVIELKNVEMSKHKFLWFAAKRFFDKYNVIGVVNFCVQWTNELSK